MSSYKLRPYQSKVVEETQQHYRQGTKHVLVVAPCGSGKSIIIADALKRTTERGNKALFLVHRQELIKQVHETLDKYGVRGVHLRTVQSLARNLTDDDYKLIVTDETHHSLAKSYRNIYDHYSETYRLGFTATPVRMSGAGLGDVYDAIVEGPQTKWLIENKYLAPYKYLAPSLIDTKRLKKRMGEYTKASVDAAMKNNIIYGSVIRHYQEHADGKKTIVYCNSVVNAEKVADEFRSHGIKAASIDAKSKNREYLVEAFRQGDLTVLTNVDLFGEGFDVPDCECVILLRPTASLSLYIQQSMRSMRYQPGKEALILDHVGNVYTHGLPDDHREWSLDGKEPVKNVEQPLIQCRKCFYVYRRRGGCPNCGYTRPIETKPMVEVADVDLVDIKDAKNMQDLYTIAKNRGYKPGWAYHQGIRLGYLQGNGYNVKLRRK